jgi:hypothetical protein
MDADDVIDHLGLQPHPEGGWYRQTWRQQPDDGTRGVGTAIYFLLAAGERSHWHRVDADEIWHHYTGDPLRLSTWTEENGLVETTLGADLAAGQHPQLRVPTHVWQSAEPSPDPATRAGWTLVGCTVSPAFEFDGFELAPPDWHPPGPG